MEGKMRNFSRWFALVMLCGAFVCKGMEDEVRFAKQQKEEAEDAAFRDFLKKEKFGKYLASTVKGFHNNQGKSRSLGLKAICYPVEFFTSTAIFSLNYGMSQAIPIFIWKEVLYKVKGWVELSYKRFFYKKDREIIRKLSVLLLNLKKIRNEKENLREKLKQYRLEIKMGVSKVKQEELKKEVREVVEKLQVVHQDEDKLFEEQIVLFRQLRIPS